MDSVTSARKYPLRAAVICFALGAAMPLQGVSRAGGLQKAEQPGQKPAALPAAPPPRAVPADRPWGDLIFMRTEKFEASAFSEYFVGEARKLPGVEAVWESVFGVVHPLRADGKADDTTIPLQGWKPDNIGYDRIAMTKGRKLQAGDNQKVILGRTLAALLEKNVGDKITFTGDRDNPYEVVGIFKSLRVIEEGCAVVSFGDAQQLTDCKGKVSGFAVRVKKPATDPAAAVEEVKKKIEALRDPKDPTVRLTGFEPEKR